MAVLRILSAFWVWLRGRWQPRRAPVPALAPPDTEANRIAVHEAGHAVAAWCCTATKQLTATITRTQGGGQVTYSLVQAGSVDSLWAETVISLAGIAAEAHVFTTFRTRPAGGDLQKARGTAELLIARGGHEPYASDELVAPFARMFVEPLAHEEHRVLSAAYLHAKTLVRSHGPVYFRLIALFMTCKSVSEKQMETVLGSRFPMLLLMSFGKVTFLCPKQRTGGRP